MSLEEDDWADFQSASIPPKTITETPPVVSSPQQTHSSSSINVNNNSSPIVPQNLTLSINTPPPPSRIEDPVGSTRDHLSAMHSSPSLLDAAPIVAAGIRAASSHVFDSPVSPPSSSVTNLADDDDFCDFSVPTISPSTTKPPATLPITHQESDMATTASTSSSSSLSLPTISNATVTASPQSLPIAPPVSSSLQHPESKREAAEEFDEFTAQFISGSAASLSSSSSPAASSAVAAVLPPASSSSPLHPITSDSTTALITKVESGLPLSADLSTSLSTASATTSAHSLAAAAAAAAAEVVDEDDFGSFEAPPPPVTISPTVVTPVDQPTFDAAVVAPQATISSTPAPESASPSPTSNAATTSAAAAIDDDDFGDFAAPPPAVRAKDSAVPSPAAVGTSPSPPVAVEEAPSAPPTLPVPAVPAAEPPAAVAVDDDDFGDFEAPPPPKPAEATLAPQVAPPVIVPPAAVTAASSAAANDEEFGTVEAAPVQASKASTAAPAAAATAPHAPPSTADDEFGDFEAAPVASPAASAAALAPAPTQAPPVVASPTPAAPAQSTAPPEPVVNLEAVRFAVHGALSRALPPLYSAATSPHPLRSLKEVLIDHSVRSRNFWGVLKCMECEASAPAHGQICVFCGSALAMTSPSEAKFDGSIIQKRFTEALHLPPPKQKKPKQPLLSSGSGSAVSEKRNSSGGTIATPAKPSAAGIPTSTPQPSKSSPAVPRAATAPTPMPLPATTAPAPKVLQPQKAIPSAMASASATIPAASAPKGKLPAAASSLPTVVPTTSSTVPVLTPAILTPAPKGATIPQTTTTSKPKPIDDDPWGGLLSKAAPVAVASKSSASSSSPLDDFLSLTPVVTTAPILTPAPAMMQPTKAQQIADELLAALPDLSFMLTAPSEPLSSSGTTSSDQAVKKATAVIDLVNFSF